MKTFYNSKQKKDGIIIDQILSGGDILPTGKFQDIMEVSTVQNYNLGTRLVIEDRVYRYAKATADLAAHRGAFCDPQMYWEGVGSMGEVDVDAKILSFDNQAVIGASVLKDGWVVGIALDSAASLYCMKIKDNKASDGTTVSPAEKCELTLYRGMPHGIEGTTHRSYVYANIYAGLKQMGGVAPGHSTNYGAVVCVPVRKITDGDYFWGMTWGVYYPVCGNKVDTGVGATVNKRKIMFDGAGGLVYMASGLSGDEYRQDAGYLLMDGALCQDGAVSSGDQLAMLTISP